MRGPGWQPFSGLKWKVHTSGMVIGSPAVMERSVYFGSTDGNLYAVDAESGAQRWKFDAKSRIPTSPAVAEKVVYFGAYDGTFYAVDAAAGALKWKFQTGGERRFAGKHLHGVQPLAETMPDPFDCYLSSPVVWKGGGLLGRVGFPLYSLNAASGALNWKFKTADVVHASPAIARWNYAWVELGQLFLRAGRVDGAGEMFQDRRRPDTHNQVGIQSSAAVADGMVYFGCRDSHLYALDAATGEKKWAFSGEGSWVVSSPAVKESKLYFVTSDSSLLYALDAKTGAVLHSVGFNHWYLYSSPALAGNVLYVGTTQGKLVAVELGRS